MKAIDILLAGGTFFGEPSTPQAAGSEKPNPGLSFFIGLRPAIARGFRGR